MLIDSSMRTEILTELKAMPVVVSIGDRDLEMERFDEMSGEIRLSHSPPAQAKLRPRPPTGAIP